MSKKKLFLNNLTKSIEFFCRYYTKSYFFSLLVDMFKQVCCILVV